MGILDNYYMNRYNIVTKKLKISIQKIKKDTNYFPIMF